MHSFKKIILCTSLFLVGTICISVVCLGCYFNTSFEYYQDADVREKLAGKLDTVYVGSSRGLCAFNSEIIDKILGTNSYNLSGSALSPMGKIAIVKEEIERENNNIKNVVIDIEDDDLYFSAKNWRSEGEINLIPRLKGTGKRISYFFKNVRFEDYAYLYSVWMNSGTKSLIKTILGKNSDDGSYQIEVKENESVDIFLSDYEIVNNRKETTDATIFSESCDKIIELIDLCQSKNINVFLVILPNSEKLIWTSNYYDSILKKLSEIANNENCKLIDFNLIRNRQNYFNDHESFSDSMHMSKIGVKSFSELYGIVMKKINSGEDVSDMFYDSYEEAITHFEYYERYTELTKGQ